jgi:oxygen-dependent protoporphyrinogen oxidase
VVGAGIAGLTAAYYLNKCGFDVRVFEREKRTGGLIRSSWREEKYLLEHGPNTYPSSSENMARLSRELSLDEAEMRANGERLVYWDGTMRPVPWSPSAIFTTKLLSTVGKARLMAEPLVRSKSPEGETLAQFVRRRGGAEVLEAIADPFVSGVWAGDPEELEVKTSLPRLYELERKYGSVMRGAAKEKCLLGGREIASYRWGMGTLPARLEEVLKQSIKLDTRVDGILRDEDDRIFVVAGDPQRRLEVDAVVIATDAKSAAALVEPFLPRSAEILGGIPFCPLAVVHTAFANRDLGTKLKGFGFFVPRSANVRMLGTVFSSSLFDNRAPSDETLLTSYIGGVHDRDVLGASDDEIVTEVRKGLHLTMDINSKPHYAKVTRLENAIPQYAVGHSRNLDLLGEDLRSFPGVFLTGNYFAGTSVSDTIGHARRVANDLRLILSRPRIRRVRS